MIAGDKVAGLRPDWPGMRNPSGETMTDTVQHRLPILKTISRAFGFVIGDAGPIIRLSWFPLLVAISLQGWLFNFMFERFADAVAQNMSAATLFTGQEFAMILAAGLGASFASCVAMVAMLRIVLYGDRKPSTYIHFAIGRAEFFVFLFPILLMLVLQFAAIVFSLTGISEVVSPDAIRSMTSAGANGPWIVFLGFASVLIWIAVRLSLYAPSIVSKRRIDIDDIVGVTRWKFVPLFAIYVLVLLMFVFAMRLFFEGAEVAGFDFERSIATEMLPTTDQQQQKAIVVAGLEAVREALAPLFAIMFLVSMLMTALFAGLTGFAYRAIKGIEPDQHLQE